MGRLWLWLCRYKIAAICIKHMIFLNLTLMIFFGMFIMQDCKTCSLLLSLSVEEIKFKKQPNSYGDNYQLTGTILHTKGPQCFHSMMFLHSTLYIVI